MAPADAGATRALGPTTSTATIAAMDEVSVVAQSDGTYRVDVERGGTTTTHIVAIPTGYAAALGREDVDGARLVEESFAFLLENEPPTSILRRFRLDQIADYFPDYPAAIRRRLETRG
jgi:hypothetical protein